MRLSVLLGIVLSACCTHTAASEPAPSVQAPADVVGMVGMVGMVGTWQSESCGERTWLRAIRLDADGTWAGRDMVSPCPAGASCIWSGVVDHTGTWLSLAQPGHISLSLTSSTPAMAPGSVPAPSTMQITDEGGVVDDAGCAYQPLGALPAATPSPPENPVQAHP